MSDHVPYTVLEHNCDRARKAEAERDRYREALRQARVDFIVCRGEMEVSTQEEFVDQAMARIEEALRVGGDPE